MGNVIQVLFSSSAEASYLYWDWRNGTNELKGSERRNGMKAMTKRKKAELDLIVGLTEDTTLKKLFVFRRLVHKGV